MTSIMLVIVSVALIIISLRDINWASKQHLRNKIDASCDPTLSAKDARELSKTIRNEEIEKEMKEIFQAIRKACSEGKTSIERDHMFAETRGFFEQYGYKITKESTYDVINSYYFTIDWSEEAENDKSK